jgi:glycosyltransferase involved in cell wall biosynthesis
MEPIKVLIIDGELICGGTEAFLMTMYRNMDRSKVQIDFMVHYNEPRFYDEEVLSTGGKIYRMTVREDNNFIKYIKDLNTFFKEHKEYKIIHGNFESFGAIYNLVAKKNGVKVRIAHSHTSHKLPGLKGFIKSICNIALKYTATDRLACSTPAGKFLFGKKPFKLYYNPIDIKKFEFNNETRMKIRTQLGLEGKFVIGHVGRFTSVKNHKFLIRQFAYAYKKNNNLILILFGSGPLMEEVKTLADRLGINDAVLFMGNRNDMDKMYQAMDLFVLPSLFEGLPISSTEAQASGLKCLLADTITRESDIIGTAEFISITKRGNSWGERMVELSNEPYERKNFSTKFIAAGFDIPGQVKKLENFYQKRFNEEYVK